MVYYSTGFFIAINYEALLMMAKHASDNNKLFGFNLASEAVTEQLIQNE